MYDENIIRFPIVIIVFTSGDMKICYCIDMNDDKLRLYYRQKVLERVDSFDIREIMERVCSLMV